MTAVSYEGRDLEVFADMANYYDWIMETFAPFVRGHVIEYGAGTGAVSRLLEPRAQTLRLVEPSANLIGTLRGRFGGNAKVAVDVENLESHVVKVADRSMDTVVLVNVLEHIEDDRQALLHLIRMLKPGGNLLIFVPALQALMSELDRVHGHFRRYHRPDLTAKVAAAGGHVVTCRYFDLAGVGPWFLLNKVLGSTAFNPALVQIHDRFVVPVSRAIERAIRPPFGKNLILVARKP